MKKLLLLPIAALAMSVTSCASYEPRGAIYTDATMGQAASGATGVKTGQACAKSYVGLIATGDASIAAAKTAGGITQVSSVDHHTTNILGAYGEYCTVVKGQ